ncbi:MAG: hypothetical protein EBV03_09890 [Proteobacteria bacterium]|nr:hypothetical protein [Pseudomonadota bacterium]
MMGFLDELFAGVLMAMRQPVEAFIQLETADDAETLVANDGSLVTYVRLLGSRQIIGDAEYAWIVDQVTLKLGSRFDRAGYAMQVYFARDPGMVTRDIDRVMRPNRIAAQAQDLDLEDLLNERRRHLSYYLAHEDIYLVLWTRPSALTKTEMKRADAERGKHKWVKADDSQYPFAALEPLRIRHKAYVSAVVAGLE